MSGVEWHPLRPFVAVSTNHGNVYVWWTGTDVHESWSAFAFVWPIFGGRVPSAVRM